ncbi:hypothetical protein [Neorhizobium alkalisoli]|uniref:Uncharacterized protein n=1 Tax=Neorhizobium alkalisoli TaxID=528178 RepID=A0A561QNR2_9HYPH|nr:hypothetical protein [Neorhizobium alkalisoli]TWF52013.1 hypothetical protein FHW37_105112 [Neorhizobium alkalisoli]
MPIVKKQQTDADLPGYVLRPEIRAFIPDVNDPEFQARLKAAIATLDPEDEAEALRWIEAVSDYDAEGLLESE